jgi:hypothetical protein
VKRGVPVHAGSAAGRVIYQKKDLWQAGNGNISVDACYLNMNLPLGAAILLSGVQT